MKVIAITESDYDNTYIHGVVTDMDVAVAFVKSKHKQKTATFTVGPDGIIVKYHGGEVYYDLREFELLSPSDIKRP